MSAAESNMQPAPLTLDAARLSVILAACQKLGAVAADIRQAVPVASGDGITAGLACERVDILAGIITCCLNPDASQGAVRSLSDSVAMLQTSQMGAA